MIVQRLSFIDVSFQGWRIASRPLSVHVFADFIDETSPRSHPTDMFFLHRLRTSCYTSGNTLLALQCILINVTMLIANICYLGCINLSCTFWALWQCNRCDASALRCFISTKSSDRSLCIIGFKNIMYAH